MVTHTNKRYRHYKNGHTYTVLAIARHSETLEELVVYRAEYATANFDLGTVWVRPRAMFEEYVSHDGVLMPRFALLDEELNTDSGGGS